MPHHQDVEPTLIEKVGIAPSETLLDDHHRHQLTNRRIGTAYVRGKHLTEYILIDL